MKKIGMKAKKTADAFLTYAILLIVSIIFVFPCFWLLLSCFSAIFGNLWSKNLSFRFIVDTPYSFKNSFICVTTFR